MTLKYKLHEIGQLTISIAEHFMQRYFTYLGIKR